MDIYDALGFSDGGREQRRRVRIKIGPFVMEYARIHASDTFHAEDLRRYVLERAPMTAPDSPGRCLRDLRQYGLLNYVVISVRDSLYQFRPVVMEEEEEEDDDE